MSNITKYCHLCLSFGENMISLYSDGCDKILQYAVNVTPYSSETFNWICSKCRRQLKLFEKFKFNCEQANMAIKKYFNNNKKKIDSVQLNEVKSTLKSLHNLSTTRVICIDLSKESFKSNDSSDYGVFTMPTELRCQTDAENQIKQEFCDLPFTESESTVSAFSDGIVNVKTESTDDFDDNSLDENYTKKTKKVKKKSGNSFNCVNISSDEIERKERKVSVKSDNDKAISFKGGKKCEIVVDETSASEIWLTKEEQNREREQLMSEDKFKNAIYKCDMCIIVFREELTLNNHMEKHSEARGPHVCSVCQQRFGSHRQLQAHKSFHTVRLVCHACGAQLRDRTSLVDHLAWHAGHKYQCHTCNSIFARRTTFVNHVRLKHGTPQYKCEVCGKMFPTPNRLKEHKGIHSAPAFVCNICNKRFSSASNLTSHKNRHTSTRRYYCVECDIYFKSSTILKNHLEKSAKHVDPTTLPFSCNLCSKRFLTSKLLSHHVDVTHLKQKKYGCEICASTYASRQGLNYHRRLAHMGYEKPRSHSCTICEKSFKEKILLTNHMRVHTGEKPFECSQCHRKFSQKSSLRTHIRLVHLKMKRNLKSKNKMNNKEIQNLQSDQESAKIGNTQMETTVVQSLPAEEYRIISGNSSTQHEAIPENICNINTLLHF